MDIMVDLETTGTDPLHTSIIQIAAVAFDIETKQVEPNHFDRCLTMAPGRRWDESTREWWSSPELLPIYRTISARMEPASEVLRDFADWASQWPDVRLWAKPSHFEWGFLDSHFTQFHIPSPFRYYAVVDLNSYIEGRGHHRKEFWKDIPFEGPKHNALFDVFHQIKGALAA